MLMESSASVARSGKPGPSGRRGPSRVLPDISVKRKETKTMDEKSTTEKKKPTAVKKVTIRTDFPETWIWTDEIVQ